MKNSPFDTRCEHLHDKRLSPPTTTKTATQAWMPYKDKLDPSKSSRSVSSLYVNIAHAEQMEELHNQAEYALAVRDRIIQVLNKFKSDDLTTRGKLTGVSEAQCIQILLQMRSKIEQDFVYKPTHYVMGEPCMLLQRRAFRCSEINCHQHHVEEVKVNGHNKFVGSAKILWVTELAFGPSHCAKSRDQGIFFNLSKREIISCTDNHQCFPVCSPSKRSNLDYLPSLPVWRYLNSDINTMATKVLQSQLEKHSSPSSKNKTDMTDECNGLQIHNEKWSWPATSERKDERITRKTLDPHVTTPYNFSEDDAGSLFSARVWNSFLDTMGSADHDSTSSEENIRCPPHRMICFPRLVSGEEEDALANGPYLVSPKQATDQEFTIINAQKKISRSERCWRSLLTFDGPTDWSNIEKEF
mmetsp:Transcript_7958/g.11798  ORF Transcript_7958/g.11798 Transcript_7958/m.11798 type:complete len:413 (+) Transcript_7958:89-1327(+)